MSDPLRRRSAGILLHPTSLPSGKLDQDVERWLDFMQLAGASVWQVLPLVIPDPNRSPYQSCSAFAMDPDMLADGFSDSRADPLELQHFVETEAFWLEDFALFHILKKHFHEAPWFEWPDAYKFRDTGTLEHFSDVHAGQLQAVFQAQFRVSQRWQQVRREAASRDIRLFGDMPLFVALDSADVWANPQQFLLDENLNPVYVAGVPPDYFSETGQHWGNPHYNWPEMQKNGFAWWTQRVRHMLGQFDMVRIDHFRGLEACWMIPAEAETAVDGFWQKTPGDELLASLEASIPDLPIVAEDLGLITPEVIALRKKYALPGMAVLQFAFDAFADNPHKPDNMEENTVAYTGTHDNNTSQGWFDELQAHERQYVFDVLQIAPREDIAHCLIETILGSRANLAIFPLQDLLQLGSEARMNVPGRTENNWQWQFQWSQLERSLADWLLPLVRQTGRCHV